MSFDFDEKIELRGTHSAKWDLHGPITGAVGDNVIPMWVADMDFRAPKAVLDVLQGEIDRGVLGYYGDDAPLRASVVNWFGTRHNWTIKPEWLYFSHGVVAGLGIVLEAFTQKDDGIILFTPVYHAFARKIESKGRQAVESLLTMDNGTYKMDLAALEENLTGAEKMVIFCSPHNPGGKLWSADEITELCTFCTKHDLILVSDEIHMDLTFPGAKHLVTGATMPEITPRLVTLSAASKGFNIAGAETSFIVIGDDKLRETFAPAHASFGGGPNRFGMLMMEAAFTDGGDWIDAATAYIGENFRIFREGVDAIPGLHVMNMDSTYLAWVDFSGTGMARQDFTDRVQKQAFIAANHGPSFGSGGETWLRFNIATRRDLVVEAVTRLKDAFSDLQ